MRSLAVCQGSLSPPSERAWGARHRMRWVESEPHRTRGTRVSQLGICRQGSPRSFWTGLPKEAVKQLVGSTSLWYSPIWVPAAHDPPVTPFTTQFSGRARTDWVSSITPHTAGKAGCSFIYSHGPSGEESWSEKVSLSIELCCLGKEVIVLLLSLLCPISDIFSPSVYWNFSTELLNFHKGTPVHGWLSQSVFFQRKVVENSYFTMIIIIPV